MEGTRMSAWSSLKEAEGPMMESRQKAAMSVIIPTYNRADLLAETLRRCVDNAGGVELEFVVIDDGSSDHTPRVLEQFEKEIRSLVWRRTPNGGPGQARNLGASLASHNLIMFMGDDIQPVSDDFFRVHWRLHQAYQSDRFAVLGKCVWPHSAEKDVNFVMAHIQGYGGEQFGYADLAPYSWIDWRFFYTGNISLKKSAVSDWMVDGFDTRFTMAAFEDIELAYRLSKEPGGYRIFYDPGALGEHIHPYSVDSFVNRQFAAGLMAVVAARLHPELAGKIGLSELMHAVDLPWSGNSEARLSDYLSVIEGIKSWARLLEAQKTLGREAWHEDLLFCVFEIAFLHGVLTNYASATSNFSEGYRYILGKGMQRLHRVVHHQVTGSERFKDALLGVVN
ncbi:glycosyltransferase family 2 protein [Vineibacter terrae]|uniref:Glycosyltransferase family 2 protein n=1 Tax=Vineibacter terrae TaxID=2586908 RepID=A0A5C8PNR6_9HYPH|nr:glycosyltransferase family 2 protein [Vineibacter terrae]TXL75671.1 glycosyltransferase family 2 protein [Vineibacter terrae]